MPLFPCHVGREDGAGAPCEGREAAMEVRLRQEALGRWEVGALTAPLLLAMPLFPCPVRREDGAGVSFEEQGGYVGDRLRQGVSGRGKGWRRRKYSFSRSSDCFQRSNCLIRGCSGCFLWRVRVRWRGGGGWRRSPIIAADLRVVRERQPPFPIPAPPTPLQTSGDCPPPVQSIACSLL